MPSFFASSARLAEMPELGKPPPPVGMISNIWSLRLKGATLRWRPVGFEGDLCDFAVVGPTGGYALGAARTVTMQQHRIRMPGSDLRPTPDLTRSTAGTRIP